MTHTTAGRYFFLAMLLLPILSACSSTRSLQEWRDESFSGQANSLLVIAALEDSERRKKVEDSYVARLAELSIEASASHEVLGDAAVNRETVESAIAGTSIDAVLVTRLLGIETVEEYRPPERHSYYRSYHRYYMRSMDYASPGYYLEYDVLTLETNLYHRDTGELVWSMQSESLDASSPQQVIDEQIGLTVKRLQANGLIGAGN